MELPSRASGILVVTGPKSSPSSSPEPSILHPLSPIHASPPVHASIQKDTKENPTKPQPSLSRILLIKPHPHRYLRRAALLHPRRQKHNRPGPWQSYPVW